MKKSANCNLQTCFMCQLALKEWKPAIDSHRKNFSFKKGELIIKEGDPVSGVYFIYSGSVKVHKKWGEKDIIVRFATKGKIFGHRGLGVKTSIYPISATALESTTVCFINKEFFLTTLKVNHDFAFNLMMFYAEDLRESEEKMRNLALMSVKSRLAVTFFHLKDLYGLDEKGCISIDLSRQDLAAFTGATYETVFRMLNELVNEKFITLIGKKIHFSNEEGLKKLTTEA
ncbi:CRP-like cAMP-binding protein [Pedobacter sp. CG_S7]|uniref:Crp/Fnr family transcriptional regulator n=1 Tax=Pedobacter sp. CG_S7 TaxID=3143930 RepID=UPI003398D9F3